MALESETSIELVETINNLNAIIAIAALYRPNSSQPASTIYDSNAAVRKHKNPSSAISDKVLRQFGPYPRTLPPDG